MKLVFLAVGIILAPIFALLIAVVVSLDSVQNNDLLNLTCDEWDEKLPTGDSVEVTAVKDNIFTILNEDTDEEIRAADYFASEDRSTLRVVAIRETTGADHLNDYSLSWIDAEVGQRGEVYDRVCAWATDGKVLIIDTTPDISPPDFQIIPPALTAP